MKELNLKDAIAVLKTLNDDWAIVDERDEDDFVIFGNESRDEMENFNPKKSFIKELEFNGYIKDSENVTQPRIREESTYYRKDSSDGEWIPITTLDPIVYFYEITEKGKNLLNSQSPI